MANREVKMNKIEEIIREKYETIYEVNRDRYIFMCIIQYYLNEHSNDYSIYDLLEKRKGISETICSDGRWKPFIKGYLTRTDYRYDENSKEIVFTTNRIVKNEGYYVSDGSNISKRQLDIYGKEFLTLSQLDVLTFKYYYKNKEKIDENLNSTNAYDRTKEDIIINEINEKKELVDLYFNSYGDIGKNILVKWLNRLNELDTNIDELLSEFNNDVKLAKTSLNSIDNINYSNIRKKHIELEDMLLDILAIYSIRGEQFRREYKQKLSQQRLLKRFN